MAAVGDGALNQSIDQQSAVEKSVASRTAVEEPTAVDSGSKERLGEKPGPKEQATANGTAKQNENKELDGVKTALKEAIEELRDLKDLEGLKLAEKLKDLRDLEVELKVAEEKLRIARIERADLKKKSDSIEEKLRQVLLDD